MATTKVITIHRHGFPHDKALKLAKALVAVTGNHDDVEITLRGPWMTRQSCVMLKTPCTARLELYDFESGCLDVMPYGYGATVDIKATLPITVAFKEG